MLPIIVQVGEVCGLWESVGQEPLRCVIMIAKSAIFLK